MKHEVTHYTFFLFLGHRLLFFRLHYAKTDFFLMAAELKNKRILTTTVLDRNTQHTLYLPRPLYSLISPYL